MHNIPENCKSDPNCSEPTTKPKDMRISPDPNNLEEWKLVISVTKDPLFNKYFAENKW